MKNLKRILAFILAVGILASNGGVEYRLMASNNKKIHHIPKSLEYDDLSQTDKKSVKSAVEKSKANGKEAGKIINEITDKKIREIGIKEVLDSYYSEDVIDKSAIKNFSNTLKEDIGQEIEEYTKARKERDNQRNLDYIAGEEIVIFDKDTTKEEIDEVVKNVSDSYEIIIDNEFTIDESLCERKKERLRALENYKGNIVVKVNLDLDQTVEKAENEFEEYACVEDAGKNEIQEQEDIQEELNDTYVDYQWYLEQCNFEAAWNSQATAGVNDIWIAVLDSGCKMSHKDLSGGLLTKYSVDVTKTDANGNYKKLVDLSKQYDSSHGTNCTGIIAAKVNNSMGIAGAARG